MPRPGKRNDAIVGAIPNARQHRANRYVIKVDKARYTKLPFKHTPPKSK